MGRIMGPRMTGSAQLRGEYCAIWPHWTCAQHVRQFSDFFCEDLVTGGNFRGRMVMQPTLRRTAMSVDGHISELRKKHAALEDRIEKDQRSPGASDLAVAELKREKLRIKEEIERLSGH
jgi:hypothetical protein